MFLRNLTLINIILFAGLFDIITTFIGVNYLGFIEINNSLIYLGIPLGVFIWCPYFIFLLLGSDYSILKMENIEDKKQKEKIKFLNLYKYIIVFISLIIPFNNLMLILGVGLI